MFLLIPLFTIVLVQFSDDYSEIPPRVSLHLLDLVDSVLIYFSLQQSTGLENVCPSHLYVQVFYLPDIYCVQLFHHGSFLKVESFSSCQEFNFCFVRGLYVMMTQNTENVSVFIQMFAWGPRRL